MTDSDPNAGPQLPPGGPPQQPPPPAGYGQPQYGQPQYGQPQYAYPAPVNTGTNGFAIASLICAFLCWPLGLIFGFIARNQIKQTHEGGGGLATAGIIISIIAAVLTVLYLVLVFTVLHTVTNGFQNFNNFVLPTPT